MTGLPDGTYDVVIVDATESPATGDEPATIVHLELALTDGPNKGAVVGVAATGLPGSEIDLLGLPATLTVIDGRPRVQLDS